MIVKCFRILNTTVGRDQAIFKDLTIFFTKKTNILAGFWAIVKNGMFLKCETDGGTFWAPLGENWAACYSKIWSPEGFLHL